VLEDGADHAAEEDAMSDEKNEQPTLALDTPRRTYRAKKGSYMANKRRVRKLYREGLSKKQILDVTGFSQTTINGYLARKVRVVKPKAEVRIVPVEGDETPLPWVIPLRLPWWRRWFGWLIP
jgi:hypothetical protein